VAAQVPGLGGTVKDRWAQEVLEHYCAALIRVEPGEPHHAGGAVAKVEVEVDHRWTNADAWRM
jgi:hypothetical protein